VGSVVRMASDPGGVTWSRRTAQPCGAVEQGLYQHGSIPEDRPASVGSQTGRLPGAAGFQRRQGIDLSKGVLI